MARSSAANPLAQPSAYRSGLGWRVYGQVCERLDHKVGWDKLPRPLGLLVLVGLRNVLRRENLYDTNGAPAQNLPPLEPASPTHRTQRTADGSHNDLDEPRMGMAGARFGRNVPLSAGVAESGDRLMTPNPRVVSRRLMTRTTFQPATTVNVLAATWIQFMVKDWFSHGPGDATRTFDVPLPAGDPWPAPPMLVPQTLADPTRANPDDGPPTFVNINTAWWDGSSIYGSNLDQQRIIRSGVDGKLNVSADGMLILPDEPQLDPTRVPGFWVGLAAMGGLFTLEHNAVCDRLKADNPTWSDEELFQRARLVVCALIAKIHTVEWTPAIISHPTTVTGLRANWFGLAGERVSKTFGRISRSEILSGIPGSETSHYGVPYSLTEEFSIVYRMHPLIPDDYAIRSAADDRTVADYTFRDLAGPAARIVLGQVSMTDLLYSFGTANPGAIVLNNFPRFLQEFQRPDGKLNDLAAVDILRTRELGVPRYNEFRRLLHLKPAADFLSLTGDADLAATMQDVYAGDIESVDTIVGMFAEQRPTGFAFSDTAFRIFILMASRRLNSDRFLSQDFTPEIYSPAGFAWVRDNDFSSVVLRHHPQLRASLHGVQNPFAPWVSSG
ncbi:peroxidase family protein [Angustibacter sp. McL0619]|uniref:peroxidase family protein n=1 Tax=Angustibacter sp. McL0619 TaxID=3415676 RepID=UPI003CF3D455